MIFKVAICDDEENDIRLLKDHLKKIGAGLDIDFEIAAYNDSRQLLSDYVRPGTFHILFLDVEMPEPNGIAAAHWIRRLPDRDVRIVFVSSYPQYMKDSFNVQAFQYLTKPYTYKELHSVILHLAKDFEESMTSCILLRTDLSEELVNINDIIFIKCLDARKKTLLVHLTDRAIEASGAIGDLEKELEPLGLVSPCRGYLINIRHLHYFQDNFIIMRDKSVIPLSRRKKKNILQLFNKKLLVLSMKR